MMRSFTLLVLVFLFLGCTEEAVVEPGESTTSKINYQPLDLIHDVKITKVEYDSLGESSVVEKNIFAEEFVGYKKFRSGVDREYVNIWISGYPIDFEDEYSFINLTASKKYAGYDQGLVLVVVPAPGEVGKEYRCGLDPETIFQAEECMVYMVFNPGDWRRKTVMEEGFISYKMVNEGQMEVLFNTSRVLGDARAQGTLRVDVLAEPVPALTVVDGS